MLSQIGMGLILWTMENPQRFLSTGKEVRQLWKEEVKASLGIGKQLDTGNKKKKKGKNSLLSDRMYSRVSQNKQEPSRIMW